MPPCRVSTARSWNVAGSVTTTVVGDLILDRYLIGDATKLNPEQPGVVIRVEREDDRLGGAAAVAMIAAGLGARVTLAGVIGRDEAGSRLRRLIDVYAARPFLLPILELGIVIVSCLQKGACLFDLPAENSHSNRIYGKKKISLAKRAGHCQGLSTING